MWGLATVASLALAGTITALGWIAHARPDVYYALLQEDGPIEWGTFFAFALAAALWGWRVRGQTDTRAGYGPALVALFCAFVAAEEISWAQRLSGVRAPTFFLAHNFQQELNVHNLAGSRTRQLVMALVLGGYGVALPLSLRLAIWSPAATERVAAAVPPVAFAPAFAAALVLYLTYPLPFTGELVEWALGMLLLLAARVPAGSVVPGRASAGACTSVGLALGAVVGLALLATRITVARAGDPAAVALAEREVVALAEDLAAGVPPGGGAPTGCGTHQRLFAFARDAGAGGLRRGRFAALAHGSGERERMAYFLDPWNQAYWIRHECGGDGREAAFVYSFGPNRRRDSGVFDLDRADVGVYLLNRFPQPVERAGVPTLARGGAGR